MKKSSSSVHALIADGGRDGGGEQGRALAGSEVMIVMVAEKRGVKIRQHRYQPKKAAKAALPSGQRSSRPRGQRALTAGVEVNTLATTR